MVESFVDKRSYNVNRVAYSMGIFRWRPHQLSKVDRGAVLYQIITMYYAGQLWWLARLGRFLIWKLRTWKDCALAPGAKLYRPNVLYQSSSSTSTRYQDVHTWNDSKEWWCSCIMIEIGFACGSDICEAFVRKYSISKATITSNRWILYSICAVSSISGDSYPKFLNDLSISNWALKSFVQEQPTLNIHQYQDDAEKQPETCTEAWPR